MHKIKTLIYSPTLGHVEVNLCLLVTVTTLTVSLTYMHNTTTSSVIGYKPTISQNSSISAMGCPKNEYWEINGTDYNIDQ